MKSFQHSVSDQSTAFRELLITAVSAATSARHPVIQSGRTHATVHNANRVTKWQYHASNTSKLLQDNCVWPNKLSLPCVIGVNVPCPGLSLQQQTHACKSATPYGHSVPGWLTPANCMLGRSALEESLGSWDAHNANKDAQLDGRLPVPCCGLHEEVCGMSHNMNQTPAGQ